MSISPDDINGYVQSAGGPQLRTFDKTITVTTNVYRQATNTPNNIGLTNGTYNASTSSGTGSASTNHRFEYTGANNNVYNGVYDSTAGNIVAGELVDPQDIVDTMEDIVRKTVDLIEGRLTNRSQSHLICHNSCHNSCHTSRGRR